MLYLWATFVYATTLLPPSKNISINLFKDVPCDITVNRVYGVWGKLPDTNLSTETIFDPTTRSMEKNPHVDNLYLPNLPFIISSSNVILMYFNIIKWQVTADY